MIERPYHQETTMAGSVYCYQSYQPGLRRMKRPSSDQFPSRDITGGILTLPYPWSEYGTM